MENKNKVLILFLNSGLGEALQTKNLYRANELKPDQKMPMKFPLGTF